MNKINLDHPYSFPALRENSEALTGLLLQESPDIDELLRLTELRESLILSHQEALDGEEKKAFLEAELACNQHLNDVIEPMRVEAELALSQLVRGKKAVKKYKK
ncbi:hypothetical protein [Bowmanella pacifica]|uniref:Uncharacterized protein n=1 Tax=Bowmanella pacifica TaxID=502051 RepID=A0A917Z448_9ALTE|nr:hypothetical protein [Bowmanella pacifica]GGO73902.1 hypothetical protein GCM10010982_35510 [Bowmanella pacifica]